MTREQQQYRTWIAEYAQGKLKPSLHTRVQERLRANAEDRAYYDRLMEGFRVLAGSKQNDSAAPGFARMELTLVESRLFAEPALAEAPERRGAGSWLGALLAFASLAGGALLLTQKMRVDEFTARGGGRAGALALDAHCLDANATPTGEVGSLKDATLQPCSLDGTLAFSWRVRAGHEQQQLSLFGVDGDGRVLYYAPTPVQSAGIAVKTVESWQPTGLSVTLHVNHRPGTLRVYGILASRVATVPEVDAWARALGEAKPALAGDAAWHTRVDTGALCASASATTDDCDSAELSLKLQEKR